MTQTPAADGQDGDDDDGPGGKGEKKKKNSYKHLIKGVPGALMKFLFSFFSILIQLSRETLIQERRLLDEPYASSPKTARPNIRI